MFFMGYCSAVSEGIQNDVFVVFLASSPFVCGGVAALQSHKIQPGVYYVGHSQQEEHGLQS